MKQTIKLFALLMLLAVSVPASAQFNLKRAVSGAAKAAKAVTLTDDQMAAYVKESVDWMDEHNPVLPEDDPYTIRLRKLTDGITEADGIPLNFKVYNVIDINAFACPDGSVRVFSSLMDKMTDEELLGVIGHEIGHVMKRHSKNTFRTQLLADALKDGVASTGGKAAALSDSQLTGLTQSLINDFLVANGKNPWGMVMAFEKLQNMEGGQKSSYFEKMFSSHPETKARIERMTKRCEKDNYQRPAAE